MEVHLSDPAKREAFRSVNFLHDVAAESIVGQGKRGYHLALEAIARQFAEQRVADDRPNGETAGACAGCGDGSTRSTGGSSLS